MIAPEKILITTRCRLKNVYDESNFRTIGKIVDYCNYFVINSRDKNLNNRFVYEDAVCGCIKYDDIIVLKLYKISAIDDYITATNKFAFAIKDVFATKNNYKTYLKNDIQIRRF